MDIGAEEEMEIVVAVVAILVRAVGLGGRVTAAIMLTVLVLGKYPCGQINRS